MKTLPLHPFLFVLYSILALVAKNLNEVAPVQILDTLALALFTTGTLTWIVIHGARDTSRGAFVASLISIWFLYFGHLYRSVRELPSLPVVLENPWALLIPWTIAFGIITWAVFWKHIQLPKLTTYSLNVIGIVLIIFPTVTILEYVIYTPFAAYSYRFPVNKTRIFLQAPTLPPDIYYIVLDGYGRADMLQSLYGYNNNSFVDNLEERGFFVASNSQSNYMQTSLSLNSSLNLGYLDDISQAMGSSGNRLPLIRELEDNAVVTILREHGYQFISVASAWSLIDFRQADETLSPYPSILNGFVSFWLDNSVLSIIFQNHLPFPSYQTQRNFITNALGALQNSPAKNGPKFIFAHILAPHPPFVFDHQGQPINPNRPYFLGDANGYSGPRDEYQQQYLDEMTFLNNALLPVIDSIITNSPTPPIIILQGDHGPGMYTNWESVDETCLLERFSILNAYFLPGLDNHVLYPGISPVNTFRLILGEYFNADLPLLQDKRFFSTRTTPYNFIDVTDMSEQPCTLP